MNEKSHLLGMRVDGFVVKCVQICIYLNVIQSYCEKKISAYFWRSQTDITHINNFFMNNNGNCLSTILKIPSHCNLLSVLRRIFISTRENFIK